MSVITPAQFALARFRLSLCYQIEFRNQHWDRMSQDIHEVTGLAIPHESLRQSIRPANAKAGEPPRIPKDKRRVHALIDYAINSGYLLPQELDVVDGLGILPHALIWFLTGKNDEIDTKDIAFLEGTYLGELGRTGDMDDIELTLWQFEPKQAMSALAKLVSGDVDGNDLPFHGMVANDHHGFIAILLRNGTHDENLLSLVTQASPSLSRGVQLDQISLSFYEGCFGPALTEDKVLTLPTSVLTNILSEDTQDRRQDQSRSFVEWSPQQGAMSNGETDSIDLRFIELCKARKFREAALIMDEVEDINILHPKVQQTALNLAASCRATALIDKLIEREDADFLWKDRRGLYAFDIAAAEAMDADLAKKIYERAVAQAMRDGVTLGAPFPT